MRGKPQVIFLANATSIHTRRWVKELSEIAALTVLSFEKAEVDGARVVFLRSPTSGFGRYLWGMPTVLRTIRETRPLLVHAHYAGGYGLMGALAGFHPFMMSIWGSDIYVTPKQSKVHRELLIFILKAADIVCSTSRAMATEAVRYVNREYFITPFGVDCSTYKPCEKEDAENLITIGTIKKLDLLYGVDRLLKAFALLKSDLPTIELRLLLVGDGPERKSLERLASFLGIAEYVEFYGEARQSEVPELLRRMSVFVALSRSESFGVAILEASASGIPVVVSDAGGLPEVVVDGETGFVIENGDPSVAAIAIKKLVLGPHLRRQMGEAGRRFVLSRYSAGLTGEVMKCIYKQIYETSATAII